MPPDRKTVRFRLVDLDTGQVLIKELPVAVESAGYPDWSAPVPAELSEREGNR